VRQGRAHIPGAAVIARGLLDAPRGDNDVLHADALDLIKAHLETRD